MNNIDSRCLVKNPEERASASELLQHEFIQTAKPSETLREMIAEAQDIKEQLQSRSLSVIEQSILNGDIFETNFYCKSQSHRWLGDFYLKLILQY